MLSSDKSNHSQIPVKDIQLLLIGQIHESSLKNLQTADFYRF